MKSREERLDRYMKVMELLPQAKAELMRYPGVRDVTVGLKETADRATETIVFRVHVEEKKPRAVLPRGGVVPPDVLGVPTDVVLEPRPRDNADDDDKYRPLQGGIQIGNDASSGVGTLGCLAKLNADQSIVMLSNRHVMLFGREAAVTSSEKIGQPNISCCCCCKSNIVGDVVNAAYNGLVDCAIARITGSPGFTNEIQDIGLVFGSATLNAGGSTVVVGDRVKKRGRTTGVTTGTVVNPLVGTPANSEGRPARTAQIQVLPDPGFAHFADGGDSGSAVLNDQNIVVGLHWGSDATWGYSCLITNVVSAMNITILNSGTPGTIPLASMPSPDLLAEEDAGAAALAEIEQALAQSERGRTILEVFEHHGREINDLLNKNRQVKVAWHRYQGPAYTAHVIQNAREPGHRIPPAIADVSPVNLLIRMSVELQQHGSPALAAAIDRHTLPLLHLMAGATSVHELVQRVGETAPVEMA